MNDASKNTDAGAGAADISYGSTEYPSRAGPVGSPVLLDNCYFVNNTGGRAGAVQICHPYEYPSSYFAFPENSGLWVRNRSFVGNQATPGLPSGMSLNDAERQCIVAVPFAFLLQAGSNTSSPLFSNRVKGWA